MWLCSPMKKNDWKFIGFANPPRTNSIFNMPSPACLPRLGIIRILLVFTLLLAGHGRARAKKRNCNDACEERAPPTWSEFIGNDNNRSILRFSACFKWIFMLFSKAHLMLIIIFYVIVLMLRDISNFLLGLVRPVGHAWSLLYVQMWLEAWSAPERRRRPRLSQFIKSRAMSMSAI